MQVSDLLMQYQNNLAAGSEISTGTKGIEQLVETAKQLKTGNIFEGTVNSIKGTQVILGLSSGQNITARLDKGVVLQKGQSVFFQVKSNDGAQVQIKPVSMGGNSGNPTLMQALDAASLPVNEKNLNMVNAMMKEQMPIDVKSLQDMSRQMISLKTNDAATVVEMSKLDIPLTESNVVQFQNYKQNEGEVLQQVSKLVEDIPAVLSDEDIPVTESLALNRQVVEFFVKDSQGNWPSEKELVFSKEGIFVPEEGLTNQSIVNKASVFSLVLGPQEDYPEGSMGKVLPQKEYVDFQKLVSDYPEFIRSNANLFDEDVQLRPEVPAKELLRAFSQFLQENAESIPREQLHVISRSKSYKHLLSHVISEQWTIKPEELNNKHSVRDLYERMELQLQKLEQMVDKYPKAGDTVASAAKNLSSNIEFMNQVNQAYTYVQIPLRMQSQNVNSELFVYRNKKEERDENEPMTAFLHFDMKHLGGMDISVKMLHKNVETNWYLDSEETLSMLAENIHLLEERLEAKGYHCSANFDTAENKVNFVEDFLKADAKTGGEVHRYSFDVRA